MRYFIFIKFIFYFVDLNAQLIAPQPPVIPQYQVCNSENQIECTKLNQDMMKAYQENLKKYNDALVIYQSQSGKNQSQAYSATSNKATDNSGLPYIAAAAGLFAGGAILASNFDTDKDKDPEPENVDAPDSIGIYNSGQVSPQAQPSVPILSPEIKPTTSDNSYKKSVAPSSKEDVSTKEDVNSDERILKYISQSKTKIMLDYAVKNKIRTGRQNSAGKCNQYVVNAVNAAGYPAWTGANAYYAIQVKDVAINSLGYINLLNDYPTLTPETSPVGSILVYSSSSSSCLIPQSQQTKSTGSGCGHIEIKTLSGYVSDYIDEVPVNKNDNRYQLKAVLIYVNK